MKLPDRLSIHSIVRVENTVGALCIGSIIASFCSIVLPELLKFRSESHSGSSLSLIIFSLWTCSFQIIMHLGRYYSRDLWARASGILSAQARGLWCLSVMPWICLYTVALLLSYYFYRPISGLWFGLWIPPWAFVFYTMIAGDAEIYSLGKLRYALSPSWPAGTLGAEPFQIGSVVDELHIIVVREITDPGLLRVLATHLGIKSFRLLPECGFVAVVCDVFPRLRSLFSRFVKTSIEQTEFEDIGLVVNQWGARSERPWHGILDDATVLVHNESETRIVAPDVEMFERYRSVLREHGREAGLGRFYLQMQGGSIVEYCEVPESLSGVEVSPVRG